MFYHIATTKRKKRTSQPKLAKLAFSSQYANQTPKLITPQRKLLKKVPTGRTGQDLFRSFPTRVNYHWRSMCLLVHKAYFFPNIDQAITAPAPSKINNGVPESLLFGLTPRSAATSVGIKMLFFLLPSKVTMVC